MSDTPTSRSAEFNEGTVGRMATRHLNGIYNEGAYETDIGVQTGPRSHGTATVEHGYVYPTRPTSDGGRTKNVFYEPYETDENGKLNNQGVLFNIRQPKISMWHGTEGNKVGSALALGAAYDFAKKQSGGKPSVSSARTRKSNDVFNRLTGSPEPATFMKDADDEELSRYGNLHAKVVGQGLAEAETGDFKGYGDKYKNSLFHKMTDDELESARTTAANAKKIIFNKPYETYQDKKTRLAESIAQKEAASKESRTEAFKGQQLAFEGL